ncbi:TPA: LamG domain-containing protein [Candidatus Poribacteria bacterium]|nr:LamG domain-containing protein [Candidatus Poribacteria bacterium]HIA66659.1 LamG domain-containing protein [Candidatus Poribacteria bacterium]
MANVWVFGGFCLLTIIRGSKAEIDPKSIVVIYLFDNDTKNAVVDSSANEYNAEIIGKPKWTEGKYGQAIQLDGATWVDVDQKNQAAFSLPLFTIAAWVGNMKVAGHQYVLRRSTGGADRNYIVNVQLGTGFFVGRFSPGGKWSPVVSTTNVADGKWHHLTQTYEKKSGKVLVYVDGVLEKERKMGGQPPANEGGVSHRPRTRRFFPFHRLYRRNTNRPHSLFCRPDSKVNEGWVGKIGPSGGLIHQSTDSDLGEN